MNLNRKVDHIYSQIRLKDGKQFIKVVCGAVQVQVNDHALARALDSPYDAGLEGRMSHNGRGRSQRLRYVGRLVLVRSGF